MNTKQISALGLIAIAGIASLGAVPEKRYSPKNTHPYSQIPTIEQYLHENFPATKEEHIILKWSPNQRLLILENMPAKDWKISVGDDEGIPEKKIFAHGI